MGYFCILNLNFIDNFRSDGTPLPAPLSFSHYPLSFRRTEMEDSRSVGGAVMWQHLLGLRASPLLPRGFPRLELNGHLNFKDLCSFCTLYGVVSPDINLKSDQSSGAKMSYPDDSDAVQHCSRFGIDQPQNHHIFCSLAIPQTKAECPSEFQELVLPLLQSAGH